MNLAAVAVYRQEPLATIKQRQRPDGCGWGLNDGKPLPEHWQEIKNSDGRFSRKMLFLRRRDVDRVTVILRPDETDERFRLEGIWVLSKRFAARCLGRSIDSAFELLCAKLGLHFRRAYSPRTGRRVSVCDEKAVEIACDKLRATRRNPPLLHGRPATWLAKLLHDVQRLSTGGDVLWGSAHRKGQCWMKKACPHLNGEKLRGAQEDGSGRRWYVDCEQAELILRSVRAKVAGTILLERRTLTEAETKRLTGFNRNQLVLLEEQKILKPVGNGRKKRYDRLEVEDIVQSAVQPKYVPPTGFEAAIEIAQKFEAHPSTVRLALRDMRRAKEVQYHQPPHKWLGKSFFYRLDAASSARLRERLPESQPATPEAAIPLVHAPAKRGRPSATRERNQTFLGWYLDSTARTFHSPAEIRNRWNRENPSESIGDDRTGIWVVKKALRAALHAEQPIDQRI